MSGPGAKIDKKSSCEETLGIKVKLRIHLTFRTAITSQSDKADAFNDGNYESDKFGSDTFAAELSAANIEYNEPDDADYNVIEKLELVVSEDSASVMEMISHRIDFFVHSWCNKSEVVEVLPCFYIPSCSMDSFTPKLFFYLYTPTFLLEKSKGKNLHKIQYKNAYVAFYNLENIQAKGNLGISVKKKVGSSAMKSAMNANHVKMFALTSYYSYLYLDLFERESWSWFNDNEKMWSEDAITDAVVKYLADKNKVAVDGGVEDAPSDENSSLFKKTVNAIGRGYNMVVRLCSAVYSIISKLSSLVVDFLLAYDDHLINRVYTRILDLLYITTGGSNDVALYTKCISNLLERCRKDEKVTIYEFYELCGYWDYLNGQYLSSSSVSASPQMSSLMEYCKQWDCSIIGKNYKKCDDSFLDKVMMVIYKFVDSVNWLTGFGAVLYENKQTQEYIYCFKGTDFDSLAKDWILTNLVQGVTGLSLQHYNAVIHAEILDEQLADKQLWFTGHSLGGGLASAATIATNNRVAYTFNAAGLNIIGVGINQFIHGSKDSRCRVFPYRIKGEVLDSLQQDISDLFAKIKITFLERGYGNRPVEFDISERVGDILKRHGIDNFLLKEVMDALDLYKMTEGQCEGGSKVLVIYNTKNAKVEARI